MRETQITRLRDRLIAEAIKKMSKARTFVEFTGAPEVDKLLNDIDSYPHAFVIACIMDRQMKAEKAWRIPYDLMERIGSLRFSDLAKLSPQELEKVMMQPEPLHRFPSQMSKFLYAAIRRIENQYRGDASAIWANRPPNAAIIRRFLDFDGIGRKIATMAANCLVREFRIPVSDCYSIDISVDIQVRRVFARMGFVPEGASEDYVIYRARELHPEYPGIFDLVLWELGRTVCRSRHPACGKCRWSELCAYAGDLEV